MRWIDRLAARLGYHKPAARSGYAAAQVSRLTASLAAESKYINSTLRSQLRILRARSREASQNNPYARRFFQMVVDNVCGAAPFQLQAKVKYKGGSLDNGANAKIEEAWKTWAKKGECDLSGRWSWSTLQRLAVRVLAVDGEVLVRIYRGPEYGRHGYQLQILDTDRLDDLKNKSLDSGGAIHMGVEVDAVNRPVAYHILKRKPSTWNAGYTPRESERVPAAEIMHLFVPDFAEQVRGVPWIYAALLNLVNLGAGEEAAVIAFRVGASQMGFIESPDGGKTLAEAGIDGHDAKGNPQFDAEPGVFNFMPPGYKLQAWSPAYPDAAFGPFLKACLRGIAAGVGVAYHNLASDMEGVNYSSARVGELDERDMWLALQAFTTEHFHEPLYADWLRMQVLTGQLPFPYERLEKYAAVYWQGKRWAWVDPAKEVAAAVSAINAKLKSRTRIIAEGGEDIEDVFTELADEEKLAAEKGIDLAPPAATPGAAADAAAADDEEKPAADETDAAKTIVINNNVDDLGATTKRSVIYRCDATGVPVAATETMTRTTTREVELTKDKRGVVIGAIERKKA